MSTHTCIKCNETFKYKSSLTTHLNRKKSCIKSDELTQLIGEDRMFGGNDLFIDLIPRGCWFSNVRTSIKGSCWDKLRKLVYERADNKCECCGVKDEKTSLETRLEAHERWFYDDIKKTQKLMRIIALCNLCHLVTHFGRANIINKGEEAKRHFMKVRKFTEEQFEEHKKEAFRLWSERNNDTWELDLTLITDNNIELVKKSSFENRKNTNYTNYTNYTNTSLLPMDITICPWLYENDNDNDNDISNNTGKWMLFYDKSLINEKWILAKKLYREKKLNGVVSMKCSTQYENPRSSSFEEGIIILYCYNSDNEETIMNIGRNILELFNYTQKQIIYYKTDLQTNEGTIATGCKKNHTYKLYNQLYKGKCLIKI